MFRKRCQLDREKAHQPWRIARDFALASNQGIQRVLAHKIERCRSEPLLFKSDHSRLSTISHHYKQVVAKNRNKGPRQLLAAEENPTSFQALNRSP